MNQKLISVILILLLVATFVCSCNPQGHTFTLQYTAAEGGYIQGEANQAIEKGKDGSAVITVVNSGYEFVGWSDGITTPIRQETNVQSNVTVTAQFAKTSPAEYTVKYLSSTGGTVQGQTTQTIEHGRDASPVTAVASENYEFVKWSDNVYTATRQDKAVTKNITVTAVFKEKEKPAPSTKTYKLNYNFGEAENKPDNITFVENDTDVKTLPVLTREHFTFHGWYCGETQVADTAGTFLLTNDALLTKEETEIYAKWTADETFTYKLLLVYPTRIDAVLPHKDPSITQSVHVDFTMSELDHEFFHLISLCAKSRLDKILDGLVDFQVDEYYLTETLTADDFSTTVGDARISSLELQYMDEVKDILPQYDSALIVYDATRDTSNHSGKATMRYGESRLDSFKHSMEVYGSTFEEVMELLRNDEDKFLWEDTYLIDNYLIENIVHELAHTIELRMNFYDYHRVVGELSIDQKLPIYQANRQYYLHEAIMDGEKVGIPYEFWKGDIANVRYNVTQDEVYGSQGYVNCKRQGQYSIPAGSGNCIVDVVYGETVTVEAKTFRDSYRFVCWSDGVTTPERTDLITGDFTVTAIFEKV